MKSKKISEDELVLAMLALTSGKENESWLKLELDEPLGYVSICFIIRESSSNWVFWDKEIRRMRHFSNPKELVREFNLVKRGARWASEGEDAWKKYRH